MNPITAISTISKSGRTIKIVGIILLIVIGFWIFTRAARFVSNAFIRSNVDLPNSGNGIPIGWAPDAIAAELWDVMDSWFVTTASKNDAWAKIYTNLTNDQITALYNRYNELYGRKDGKTLTQKISDEIAPFSSEKTLALNTLRRLYLN